MKGLKWTREFPKEEGYYWCRFSDGECIVCMLGFEWSVPAKLVVYFVGDEEQITQEEMEDGDDVEWYGPLRVPE